MLDTAQTNLDSLITALKTAEVAQKKRHNSVTEIDDVVEATFVANDAWAKIKHIKGWIKSLQQIKDEIADVFPDSDVKLVGADNAEPPITSKPNKQSFSWEDDTESFPETPSGYVHKKLSALSKSGYVFTDEQLRHMQSPRWSRNILNLPHQFMHVYDLSKGALAQALTVSVANKYLVKERLRFGSLSLIFYSDWTEPRKASFDLWYDSLEIADPQPTLTAIDTVQDEVKVVAKELPTNIATDPSDSDQPTEIVLLGKIYPVCNWQEVFLNLCEVMVLKQPYKMAALGADFMSNPPETALLSYDKQGITHASKQLSNGLFADISGSESEIKSHCKEVLEACGYNNDILKIN